MGRKSRTPEFEGGPLQCPKCGGWYKHRQALGCHLAWHNGRKKNPNQRLRLTPIQRFVEHIQVGNAKRCELEARKGGGAE